MTLEEKIKERITSEAVTQSKEFDCDFFVARHSFTKGAVWMLSELKPVMEEMESCIKSTLATIDSPDTFINQILPEKDSYFKPDALVKELKSTLSKYNELFKK